MDHRLEIFARAAGALSLAYAFYWLWWRWTATFNTQSPIYSTVLLVAETYGVFSTAMLLFTVWKLRRREPVPAPAGRTVDVFITCYDEPLQLIRRTALAARDISYPHETYILDDGKRDEVRSMADELGIGYLRREGNEHAKAGNLNHALSCTQGEFILQLDADHVPLTHILDRMLGYFTDERVAFVQSPQDFYNTSDSFTHVVNKDGHRFWEENRIFFSLIQPGKDRSNAAFFCGSCGMLRRAAMEEIGGFSTLTITEDMETSIVLHSRGWKSVYHDETLAYGLAPASAGQYHVQRLRWGQGSIQILRKMNPLFYRGLSWRQRVLYFSSVFTYFDGLQKLVFYAAPLVFFYFGAIPLRTTDAELLKRLVPYIALTVVSFELLSRGTGWILISERYNMTKFWTYILALSALFTRKPLKFQVTPKGEGDVPWRTYAPQLTVGVLSALAIPFAFLAYRFGWVHYEVSGLSSAAFALNGIWVVWNCYFAAVVVRHSIRSRQQRKEYRFADALPLQVRTLTAAGVQSRVDPTTAADLNVRGMAFRGTQRFEVGTRVELPLALSTGDFLVRGTVMRSTSEAGRFGDVHLTAVVFDEDTPIAVRDAIELHCSHHSVPLWQRRHRQSVHVVSHLLERLRDLRVGARWTVYLPAAVTAGITKAGSPAATPACATLEEISADGGRLIMSAPLEPGTIVHYEVAGSSISRDGTVVFSRSVGSALQERYIVGVRSATKRSHWWSRAFSRGGRAAEPAAVVPPAEAPPSTENAAA